MNRSQLHDDEPQSPREIIEDLRMEVERQRGEIRSKDKEIENLKDMLERSLEDISKKEETIAKATHVVESLKREMDRANKRADDLQKEAGRLRKEMKKTEKDMNKSKSEQTNLTTLKHSEQRLKEANAKMVELLNANEKRFDEEQENLIAKCREIKMEQEASAKLNQQLSEELKVLKEKLRDKESECRHVLSTGESEKNEVSRLKNEIERLKSDSHQQKKKYERYMEEATALATKQIKEVEKKLMDKDAVANSFLPGAGGLYSIPPKVASGNTPSGRNTGRRSPSPTRPHGFGFKSQNSQTLQPSQLAPQIQKALSCASPKKSDNSELGSSMRNMGFLDAAFESLEREERIFGWVGKIFDAMGDWIGVHKNRCDENRDKWEPIGVWWQRRAEELEKELDEANDKLVLFSALIQEYHKTLKEFQKINIELVGVSEEKGRLFESQNTFLGSELSAQTRLITIQHTVHDEKLKESLARTNDRVEQIVNDCERISKEYQQAMGEREKLFETISLLESQRNKLKGQLGEKTKFLRQLHDNLALSFSEEDPEVPLAVALEKIKDSLKTLQEQKLTISLKQQQLDAANSEMRAACEELKNAQRRILILEDGEKNLSRENQILKNENQQLCRENIEAMKKNRELYKDKTGEDEIQGLIFAAERRGEETRKELENKLAASLTRVQKLETENKEIGKVLRDLEEEVQETGRESEAFSSRLYKKKEKLKIMKAQAAGLKKEIERLSRLVEDNEREARGFMRGSQSFQSERDTSRRRRSQREEPVQDSLKGQVIFLKGEVDKLREELKAKEKEIAMRGSSAMVLVEKANTQNAQPVRRDERNKRRTRSSYEEALEETEQKTRVKRGQKGFESVRMTTKQNEMSTMGYRGHHSKENYNVEEDDEESMAFLGEEQENFAMNSAGMERYMAKLQDKYKESRHQVKLAREFLKYVRLSLGVLLSKERKEDLEAYDKSHLNEVIRGSKKLKGIFNDVIDNLTLVKNRVNKNGENTELREIVIPLVRDLKGLLEAVERSCLKAGIKLPDIQGAAESCRLSSSSFRSVVIEDKTASLISLTLSLMQNSLDVFGSLIQTNDQKAILQDNLEDQRGFIPVTQRVLELVIESETGVSRPYESNIGPESSRHQKQGHTLKQGPALSECLDEIDCNSLLFLLLNPNIFKETDILSLFDKFSVEVPEAHSILETLPDPSVLEKVVQENITEAKNCFREQMDALFKAKKTERGSLKQIENTSGIKTGQNTEFLSKIIVGCLEKNQEAFFNMRRAFKILDVAQLSQKSRGKNDSDLIKKKIGSQNEAIRGIIDQSLSLLDEYPVIGELFDSKIIGDEKTMQSLDLPAIVNSIPLVTKADSLSVYEEDKQKPSIFLQIYEVIRELGGTRIAINHLRLLQSKLRSGLLIKGF